MSCTEDFIAAYIEAAFWLTRNNHGAGFWETSDWEESAGELLTAFSHVFPECHLFVDDSKVICCE